MSQQFVKNTDKPSSDSVLWEFADDWKISGNSGLPYASLPGVERVNDELYEGLRAVIKSKNLDVVEYQSYYLVLTLFDKKENPKDPNTVSNWHVFSFENEADAKKKNEYQKKFIKWDSVPKPPVQQQPGQKTTTTALSSKPVVTSSSSSQIQQQPDVITTFTDPKWIDDENRIKELQSNGYSFIPASLCTPNFRVIDVHDTDEETGKDTIIGENYSFLMGRIINVKIAEN